MIWILNKAAYHECKHYIMQVHLTFLFFKKKERQWRIPIHLTFPKNESLISHWYYIICIKNFFLKNRHHFCIKTKCARVTVVWFNFSLHSDIFPQVNYNYISRRAPLMVNYSISRVNTQNCSMQPNRNMSLQRSANSLCLLRLSRRLYFEKKSNMLYPDLFVIIPGVIMS